MKKNKPATPEQSEVAGTTSPTDKEALAPNRPFSTRDEVYERIKQIPPSASKMGSNGHMLTETERELTLNVMLKNLQQELETLKEEALLRKDMGALRCLHAIAFEGVRQLLFVTSYAPEFVAKVAKAEEFWPTFYNKHAKVKRSLDELVDAISLGQEASGTFDTESLLARSSDSRDWISVIAGLMGRIRDESIRCQVRRELRGKTDQATMDLVSALLDTCSPEASEQEVHEHLKRIALARDQLCRLMFVMQIEDPSAISEPLDRLVSGARSLPKLSKNAEVTALWMAVIRQFVTEAFEGHPEKSVLRQHGLANAKSKSATALSGTKSYEANIRDGIFKSLKDALVAVAP